MNFLMLRGEVPRDRNPQEIVFDSLDDMDDMWTLLFNGLLKEEDQGELWYWGGTREKQFTTNFVERWVPDYGRHKTSFVPDVIFCRGGFPQYDVIMTAFPDALKIYYGAGRRFIPQHGFKEYDILLQDSPTQVEYATKHFPQAKSVLFFKPAPDNLFKPLDVLKTHDICFPADGRPNRKGHTFVYKTVPYSYSVLNVGFEGRYPPPINVDNRRVVRSKLAHLMSSCKMGIVASTKGTGLFGLSYDSCPRVIPEMLACNLPIVVLDELEFWADKYIVSPFSSRCPYATGEIANRDTYWDVVNHVLHNLEIYQPRKYYETHLTVEHASEHLRRIIDEARV